MMLQDEASIKADTKNNKQRIVKTKVKQKQKQQRHW
jgi:hypothetical protein